MKNKEIVEEVAEKISESCKLDRHEIQPFINGFIEGTKYQSERMYGEEEVKRLCSKAWLKIPNTPNMLEEFDKWFEQFKKNEK